MNGPHLHDPSENTEDIVELGAAVPRIGLHRLAAARHEKGISCHAIARQLGISVEEVRLQEEAADLSIGTLSQWAAALKVPVTDLIVEPEEYKHSTRLAKAEAERLMRVAAKLRDRTRRRGIQRLAQTFVEQLAEILPVLNSARQTGTHRTGRPSDRQSPPRHPNGRHAVRRQASRAAQAVATALLLLPRSGLTCTPRVSCSEATRDQNRQPVLGAARGCNHPRDAIVPPLRGFC